LITQQLRARACASILAAATLLAGCGGAVSDAQSSIPCTQSTPAGCGGSLPPPSSTPTTPPAADPAAKAASISLVFSSNELPSAGAAGTDVVVTALVKTADNMAVTGAKVDFSADSGLLAAASAVTDQTGKVSATLGTGGSKLNRAITVKAKVGTQLTSGVVNVTGTKLSVTGPAFLAIGTSADLVATLVDSAGQAISGVSVTPVTANGNLIQAVSKVSDSRGKVTLQLTASTRGSEQVTLTALGASVTRSILVGGSDVTVTPPVAIDASGAELLAQVPVGSCASVGGSYMIAGIGQSGTVTLNASRGTLYRDAACSVPFFGAMTLAGGAFPAVWIKSDNAGVSSIEAGVAGGPSGSTRVEFTAALCDVSTVNLQADAAVVGSGEKSTLIAVVRDGTPANNLVKGATVQFSILADPSGGTLLSPFTTVTGSDGIARAVYVAGAADGGKNGTVIQARIAELPAATSVTNLTVNKKALSIQFGTGNQLIEFSSAVLQQDFAVFVSDSAGNPVADVPITASAWPTFYKKGVYEWFIDKDVGTDVGFWVLGYQKQIYTCANEDVQRKGLYETAYDTNNNHLLEPGIPLSVSISGRTDAMGMATVSLRYPRDRANWVKVELTVSGVVAGTESSSRNNFWLLPLSKDLSQRNVSPPGAISPYGTSFCNSAN
jgi:hypothetical protein